MKGENTVALGQYSIFGEHVNQYPFPSKVAMAIKLVKNWNNHKYVRDNPLLGWLPPWSAFKSFNAQLAVDYPVYTMGICQHFTS